MEVLLGAEATDEPALTHFEALGKATDREALETHDGRNLHRRVERLLACICDLYGGAASHRRTRILQLQADATGVPVQRGAVDATVAGAASLAAVGAGIWPSTHEIAERVPPGNRAEPRRDDAWRAQAHAEWREFVERASLL